MLAIELSTSDYNNNIDINLSWYPDSESGEGAMAYLESELSFTRNTTPEEAVERLRQLADTLEFQEGMYG